MIFRRNPVNHKELIYLGDILCLLHSLRPSCITDINPLVTMNVCSAKSLIMLIMVFTSLTSLYRLGISLKYTSAWFLALMFVCLFFTYMTHLIHSYNLPLGFAPLLIVIINIWWLLDQTKMESYLFVLLSPWLDWLSTHVSQYLSTIVAPSTRHAACVTTLPQFAQNFILLSDSFVNGSMHRTFFLLCHSFYTNNNDIIWFRRISYFAVPM